jgi:hypothetical protein
MLLMKLSDSCAAVAAEILGQKPTFLSRLVGVPPTAGVSLNRMSNRDRASSQAPESTAAAGRPVLAVRGVWPPASRPLLLVERTQDAAARLVRELI